MTRRGERTPRIPTLWHLGFGQPFRVVRKRKGHARWTSREYAALTRASAWRWERLVHAGRATRRRDTTLDALLAFGVTTIGQVQTAIREQRTRTSQDKPS